MQVRQRRLSGLSPERKLPNRGSKLKRDSAEIDPDEERRVLAMAVPELERSELLDDLCKKPNSRASRFQSQLNANLDSEVMERVKRGQRKSHVGVFPEVHASGIADVTKSYNGAMLAKSGVDVFSSLRANSEIKRGPQTAVGALLKQLKEVKTASEDDTGKFEDEFELNSPGPLTQEPEPGLSKWSNVRRKFMTTIKLKQNFKEMTKPEKRASYVAGILPSIRDQTHIKLSRRVLSHKELFFLKKYFDSFDLDGNGTVTMREVCTVQRQSQKDTKKSFVSKAERAVEENVHNILVGINRDMTFEDMLEKTYSDINKQDIELCMGIIRSKQPKPEPDWHTAAEEPIQTEKKKFLEAMFEVKEYWDQHYNPLGVITINSFASMLRVLGEERTLTEYKEMYLQEAHPTTGKMHRRQFTLWWLNLCRKEPLKWSEIGKDAESFWREHG